MTKLEEIEGLAHSLKLHYEAEFKASNNSDYSAEYAAELADQMVSAAQALRAGERESKNGTLFRVHRDYDSVIVRAVNEGHARTQAIAPHNPIRNAEQIA